MTHEEVYQELERDREAVTLWWWHQKVAMRRRVLKCTKFPMSMWFEYTSPRKNRYLIQTRIFDKRMKHILTGALVLRWMRDGITVYTTWVGFQQLISPMVLVPHMFHRYAERAGINKTGIDLIKHYFEHNPHGEDSQNQKVVGRSVRYNGEEHQSCCVNDGVVLGQNQDGIYIVRTFITYDMCTGFQKEHFGQKRENILTDEELYKKAKQHYKDEL